MKPAKPYRSRRLIARVVAGLLVVGSCAASITPTLTMVFGHDDRCALDCDGNCEPGCLSCRCIDREAVSVLQKPSSGVVALIVAEPIGETTQPSLERSTSPPYRPPRA